MKGILGLGNPGGRYQLTRHNVGFMFIDRLADLYDLSLVPSRHDFYAAEGMFEGTRFGLVKPTTFMNDSGNAAAQFLQQYKMKPQDLMVVYDDLNLPFGDIRIRFGGSHGGHNGILSMIFHLNTNQFPRLRIGIGGAFEKGKMTQFVLGKLTLQEFETMQKTFTTCNLLVQAFITGGIKKMLDENSKLGEPGPAPAKEKPPQAASEKHVPEHGAGDTDPDEESEINYNR